MPLAGSVCLFVVWLMNSRQLSLTLLKAACGEVGMYPTGEREADGGGNRGRERRGEMVTTGANRVGRPAGRNLFKIRTVPDIRQLVSASCSVLARI